MYLSQAEKKNEIKALTGPKCGSEYVYLTADGKSSYMFCGVCNSKFFVRGLADDTNDKLLNKCMKCEKFLCDKCKNHYNEEELVEEGRLKMEEDKLLALFCNPKSSILSTYKTLLPFEEFQILNCDGCQLPLNQDNEEEMNNLNAENEEHLFEDDYKIFNCRSCNKKLCENCSLDHSSKENIQYMKEKLDKDQKKEIESCIKKKSKGLRVPCPYEVKEVEAIDFWPGSQKNSYNVYCEICRKFIDSYKPYYSCIFYGCKTCNISLCSGCIVKHNKAIRDDCTPNNPGLISSVRQEFNYGNKEFTVTCGVCYCSMNVEKDQDASFFYCWNCYRWLCGNCKNNHNGNFFSIPKTYETSYLIDGPESLKQEQYNYIDGSIKCSECQNCAINRYGQSWICEMTSKRYCESCKGYKPRSLIPQSKSQFKQLFKQLNDPFNCGKDMIKVDANMVREENSFLCNYEKCRQRVDCKDTKVWHCERCTRNFCNDCSKIHCTPKSKEYMNYLVVQGKDYDTYRKKKKELAKLEEERWKKYLENKKRLEQERREKEKKNARRR